jgi:DNA-binding CsgD family transcriptional regulator
MIPHHHYSADHNLLSLLTLTQKGVATGIDLETLLKRLETVAGAHAAFVQNKPNGVRSPSLCTVLPRKLARQTQMKRAIEKMCAVLPKTPSCRWCATDAPPGNRAPEELTAVLPGPSAPADWIRLGAVAATRLCHPDCECLYLGLARFSHEKPFDRSELAFLDLLSPHLQGALATHQALSVLADPGVTGFEEAMAKSDAFTLIDLARHQVSLSPAAEKTITGWSVERNGKEKTLTQRMILTAARAFLASPAKNRRQLLIGETWIELFQYYPDPSINVPTQEAYNAPLLGKLAGQSKKLVGFFHQCPVRPLLLQRKSDTPACPAEALLTCRQRQIARLAAAGKSVAEIAKQTHIRFETARTHIRNIYRQLGISNRTQLAQLIRPAQPTPLASPLLNTPAKN